MQRGPGPSGSSNSHPPGYIILNIVIMLMMWKLNYHFTIQGIIMVGLTAIPHPPK